MILNSNSVRQFVTQRPIRPLTCLFLSHHALFIAALCPGGKECWIDSCSEAQIELICSLQDLPYTCSLVGRPAFRLWHAISGPATSCYVWLWIPHTLLWLAINNVWHPAVCFIISVEEESLVDSLLPKPFSLSKLCSQPAVKAALVYYSKFYHNLLN